jgi:L-rhamnose-H+ transport protein
MVWGIGAILFGLCVIKIGVALTYSIVLGLVAVIGSVLPIFINHISFTPQAFIFLLIGLLIIVSGVFLSGFAGVLKEKIRNPKQSIALDGIILAVISGFSSSLLNVGFITGKDISLHAQKFGVPDINASSLVWLVVLFGGLITNFGYAFFILIKNKTFRVYKRLTRRLFLPIFISALFWYATFALFGIGSVKLGSLGPSVGWAMLISLSIVVSNVWGIKFKEWKGGVKKALKLQLGALGLIIVGVAFVTLSAF